MTERLTETQLTETLDEEGRLDTARQPGVYALTLRAPSADADRVARAWAAHFGAPPPDGLLDRFTTASRLCYVGSHGKSMYDRLCQHVKGYQSSTIMDVWPPVGVAGLWPAEQPDAEEFNAAVALASEETVVWMDGDFL